MKISDGTYVYDVQELEDGGESRGIAGNHARLTLTESDGVVTVAYVDWQGNPMPEEDRPILVNITGTITQELALTPVDGKAAFDMPTAGCVIRARAGFPCDMAKLRT